ncbi:ABC transporter permease [Aerococcus viridans]|uniref:ABC transporter permease n=1 Tax=Aerococcus viridans TaxID=1377 RepID=UPI0039AF7105
MTRTRKILFRALFLLAALFLFLFPILTLVKMSFESGDSYGWGHYSDIFESSRTLAAIKNTIIIGVLSTLLSLVMGVAYAVIVAYTNVRHKRLIEILVLLPYVVPGYVVTMSWTALFAGNSPINTFLRNNGLPPIDMYSMWGIIVVMGISNAAIVYLNVLSMLRQVPVEQEWASLTAGYNKGLTLRNINLRTVLPAIVNGTILAFLSSIDNFAIPSFLGTPKGINVLSTYIYEKAIGFGPSSFNEAAVLSVFLSGIAFIGLAIQALVLRKSTGLEASQPDYQERLVLKGWRRKLVQGMAIFFLVLINIVPLVMMFFSSLHADYTKSIFDFSHMSFENYQFIFTNKNMYSGFLTSLTLTLSAIVICVLISVPVMYYKQRFDKKATAPLELGAALTYSMPGMVLALAMIFYWSNVPNIYGTMRILLIAYVTRYILLLLKGSDTALLAVSPDLEEAVKISGSKTVQRWRKIIIPIITNQILSSSFLMFTAAFTELTLSSLLAAANSKTVGLTIFNLQSGGDQDVAQAYSVLLTLFILIIVILRNHLERKERLKNG